MPMACKLLSCQKILGAQFWRQNAVRSLSAREVPFPGLWFRSFPVGYFQWLLCCFHSGIKSGSNEKQVVANFKF